MAKIAEQVRELLAKGLLDFGGAAMNASANVSVMTARIASAPERP